MTPLVEIKHLSHVYGLFHKATRAVHDLSFSIFPGETLALVGESGCGKSTVGKILLNLLHPTKGEVLYRGKALTKLSKKEMRLLRRKIQIVFQDPYASLNPRMTTREIIGEPLDIHHLCRGKKRSKRIEELAECVGLRIPQLNRFPHEFSGGQRQRIAIARALACEPEFLVLDEPTSALDVSVQAQIVSLLRDLQKKMKLTYLLISHDLALVKYLSDRVAVMRAGELVELQSSEQLYAHPQHPYTRNLLESVVKIPCISNSGQESQVPASSEA